MTVRRTIPFFEGVYFITFTCWQWMNLFEECEGYYAVYKWFDVLKSQGHNICGYVVMPNHFHGILAFRNTMGVPINTIVGNGKRFIAYELVKQLREQNATDVLTELQRWVRKKDSVKGKLHEVFEPSFDWKECYSRQFIEQKLQYIHNNPCSGKWRLAEKPWEYLHSSAYFYHSGCQRIYDVFHYQDLDQLNLTNPFNTPTKES